MEKIKDAKQAKAQAQYALEQILDGSADTTPQFATPTPTKKR